MNCNAKNCNGIAKFEVKFDAAVKGIDKKFLCNRHYNVPPFDKFVVNVIKIRDG